MTDETVIPPVASGTTESSIEWDYKRRAGRYQWRAVATHSWEFDSRAYHDQTGLDLGADFPYVPQENGHALRVRREFRLVGLDRYDPNDGDTGTLMVEEEGMRGTYSPEYYWSLEGDYRLEYKKVSLFDDDWEVVRCNGDDALPNIEGQYFKSLDYFVRAFHYGNGPRFPTPEDLFKTLLEHDTPDDAIPAADYQHKDEVAAPMD